MADSISHRPAGLITISAACGDSLPGRKLDHSSFESHLKVAHFHADDTVSDFSLALGHMDNDRLFFMFLKTPNFSRRFRSEETERFFFLPPSTPEIMEMTARTAKKLEL